MQPGDARWWIWRAGHGTCVALLLWFSSAALRGQSLPARTRSAELSAFGMYTNLTPDYGIQPDFGYTVGVDFTKIFKFTALSLELRYKDADGPTVREQTLGAGPRFEYRWSRVHLYTDLLASGGKITFADKNARGSNGTGANGSVVYTYGAGVDLDLTGQWAVQFDYQSEHWDLEEKPKILLFPNAFSVGIVYHLRFSKDRSRW
jgi:outer membrane protein with beta-barrel domain